MENVLTDPGFFTVQVYNSFQNPMLSGKREAKLKKKKKRCKEEKKGTRESKRIRNTRHNA